MVVLQVGFGRHTHTNLSWLIHCVLALCAEKDIPIAIVDVIAVQVPDFNPIGVQFLAKFLICLEPMNLAFGPGARKPESLVFAYGRGESMTVWRENRFAIIGNPVTALVSHSLDEVYPLLHKNLIALRFDWLAGVLHNRREQQGVQSELCLWVHIRRTENHRLVIAGDEPY
jgi:hypothetical protein